MTSPLAAADGTLEPAGPDVAAQPLEPPAPVGSSERLTRPPEDVRQTVLPPTLALDRADEIIPDDPPEPVNRGSSDAAGETSP